MGPPARVSVVIPCYNYARFLGAAVGSVLAQEDVQVDVVIVDDASTDDSLDLAQVLSTADDRIRVIKHSQNKGPVVTFNDGLAETDGEFIVRLDADDMLTPGSLSRSVALARAWPSVGLVYGHPIHFEGAPAKSVRTTARSWTVWPGAEWLQRRCAAGKNVITAPEALMRAAVVDEVGGQQPLAHSHDMEMWMRISAHSDVGHIEGADQAWHRDHDLSLSAREVNMVSDLFDRREAFEVLFAADLPSKIQSGRLSRKAKEALAIEALTRACHLYDRGRGTEDAVLELLEFANQTWPGSTGSRQWRALQRRIRIGTQLVPHLPWYVAQAALRRFVGEAEYHRWSRDGV
ncbi:glycosyltransferase family A protein [Specibacter sp. NPDC078692]|uniref:glycosyltransferase family 2 protein n=1 Tax=Specibacter sp. NPDC078692 TaxID=3155818 RepID=UPI00343CA41B